jgi:uncharacterized protein Yka (UPF0111/DUF47 family)
MYLASKRIHDVEHEGDELVHSLMDRLNKSFITPLDREDIYELTSRLGRHLGLRRRGRQASRHVQDRRPDPSCGRARAASSCAAPRRPAIAVALLRDLSKGEAIIRQCAKINQFENDADQVMRDALNELFNGAPKDPLDVIKWKDIYEHLELATDKCEDVANIIESVLVKYS